jgi:hypothetical protein
MLFAVLREGEQVKRRYENDGTANHYLLHINLHFLFHDSALDLIYRFDSDLLVNPKENTVQPFLLLLPGLLNQLLWNSVLHYFLTTYEKELISGFNFISHRVLLLVLCNYGSSHSFISSILSLDLPESLHELMHKTILLAKPEHLKWWQMVTAEY